MSNLFKLPGVQVIPDEGHELVQAAMAAVAMGATHGVVIYETEDCSIGVNASDSMKPTHTTGLLIEGIDHWNRRNDDV